jgi:DNA-binding HxlR family transcriptional regulator
MATQENGSTQFFLPCFREVIMAKDTSIAETIDYDNICPIVYALSIIGQKWKIPILWHLAEEGTLRYNELKRGVYGITNMMLTKSLQELEVHGLITRTSYNSIPPKVEYTLSERGRSLIPLLKEFDAWGRSQIDYDRAKS